MADLLPTDPTEGRRRDGERRIALALLALAAAVFVVGALRDLTAPWEDGLRGVNAAVYEECFVRTILDWPISVSHLAPGWVFETDHGPVCHWHWHHPPLYPLSLSAFALLLGQEPWVLRLATLLLVLPAVFGVWFLLGRAVSPLLGGLAALLFAANAMIGYFLPMVVHDGATISAGICACAAFWRFTQLRTRKSLALAASFFLLSTWFDFLGHFWGVAIFLLALAAPDRRAALRGTAILFGVSLCSLLAVFLHYSTLFGGMREAVVGIFGLAEQQEHRRPSFDELAATTRAMLLEYRVWPLYALAGVGLVCAAVFRPRHGGRIAWFGLALTVPGILGSLISLRHYVDHAFWSMPAVTGISVLAALAPWTALQARWPATALARAGRIALLLLAAATAAHGAASVHELVVRFRPRNAGFASMAAEAGPYARGCAVALTNCDIEMRSYLPGVMFVGKVRTGAELDAWLDFGRTRGMVTDVTFVLDHAAPDASLVARLGALSEPRRLERVTVYRFRP